MLTLKTQQDPSFAFIVEQGNYGRTCTSAVLSLATPFKISLIDGLTSQVFDLRSQCSASIFRWCIVQNFSYSFAKLIKTKLKLASWSSGNAFVSVARDSNLGPLKSNTVLPTACHRRNIFSKEAMSPDSSDAELGPVNSLHAST